MTYWNTPKFKKLEATWYKKLEKTGFKELENTGQFNGFLKKWEGVIFSKLGNAKYQEGQALNDLMLDILRTYKFESIRQKAFWKFYTAGLNQKEISLLYSSKQKKRKVSLWIVRKTLKSVKLELTRRLTLLKQGKTQP